MMPSAPARRESIAHLPTDEASVAFERRIQEQEKDEKHEKHKMTRQMTLAEQMLQEQADNLQSRNSFAVQSYKFMFDS